MTKALIGVSLTTAVVLSLPAQSSQPLAFEVASVKHVVQRFDTWMNFKGPSDTLRGITGDRFKDESTTVADLIMDAYRMKEYQIIGLPSWAVGLRREKYKIEAKAGIDSPTEAQVRQMLQTLLADRFQLKLHREQRELPVYALTVGKSGSKLKEIPADSQSGMSVQSLISILAHFVDRPVLDKTGLVAPKYQFSWDQTELLQQLRELGAPVPSISSAVQDQLGLKLERQNEPLEVLVIDSVERPSEN